MRKAVREYNQAAEKLYCDLRQLWLAKAVP